MSRKSLKFLFFLFLVLSFLSFGQFVLADEPREGETQDCGTCGVQTYECDEPKELNIGTEESPIIIMVTDCDWSECDETPEPDDEDESDWYEYRCQGTGCGQQHIERQYCSKERSRSVECKGNGEWEVGAWSSWSTPSCSATPSTIEECDLDWQLCSGGTEWTKTKDDRSCDCAGACLETPKNPRYYNNPNYPTDPYEPEESEDPNNIFLPVKLDWDNVKAWKNGWREEGGVLEECSEDCFQSYLIEIDNTADGNFSKTLENDSEYNPNACFLKSDTTHNWKVSACCGTDDANCGDPSEWSFTTKSAPEPVSPEDPDWAGNEIIENMPLPVSLKWCQVKTIDNEKVLSYVLTPYLIDEDIICHPARQNEQGCSPILVINPALEAYHVEYINEDLSLFTKLNSYAWQVAACKGKLGGECGEWSQVWGFQTGEQVLEDVELISPPNNATVGFPVILEWNAPPGINSFQYELYKNLVKVASGSPNPPSESNILLENLELNTEYKWRVRPCNDFEGGGCESWSEAEEWEFKTTGAPTNLISPENNASNVSIPIKLEWENMSGAKSYRYSVYSGGQLVTEGTTSEDFVLIKYNPDLGQPEQEVTYSWQVATCADEEGEICGSFTDPPWEFTTFKLSSPSNLLPGDNETIFTYQMPKGFSWDSNAKYFRFILDYIEKAEEDDNCSLGIEEKNIDNNFYSLSLSCLGEYRWQVQACLDENCEQKGELTPFRYFTLNQTTPPAQFGLVPCGRSSNNPDTPWNERNPCQFKHLFVLLRNILDLLLWRVTLIIFLLLVVASAVIFYFSIGAPAMIIDIRGVWKAAGKGYAIIFLSWIIINLVLNILGYQVGIFGQWWQINF